MGCELNRALVCRRGCSFLWSPLVYAVLWFCVDFSIGYVGTFSVYVCLSSCSAFCFCMVLWRSLVIWAISTYHRNVDLTACWVRLLQSSLSIRLVAWLPLESKAILVRRAYRNFFSKIKYRNFYTPSIIICHKPFSFVFFFLRNISISISALLYSCFFGSQIGIIPFVQLISDWDQ